MDHNTDKQVYLQVIEYIGNLIDEGKLTRGDKIPPERKLVEQLGVGRNSIREALKVLDIIGIVDRKQGNGTFIREEFDHWFSEPMYIAFMLSENSMNEIFEFRNMIEVEIATLAAKRITDKEIKELEACYKIFNSEVDEVVKTQYDIKFHHILSKASKNIIIINSYNAMNHMLNVFVYNLRVSAYNDVGRQLAFDVHENLYQAIIARNPEKARKAMREHMDVVKRYYV